MPSDAPRVKLEATASHGAEIVTYDRYGEDRERVFRDLVARRGLSPIHPFDDPRVIAGQGTVALELIEDAGALDVLVAPVSGGGLLSGCATAAKALAPGIRVIGVEPEAADDVARSLAAGERVSIDVPRTIADALQVTSPGELTFGIISELVDEVVTVSDEEIVAAMRACLEGLGLVAEPSGAVALAAVLAGRIPPDGRVGVVVTGGNVDPERFERLVGRPVPDSRRGSRCESLAAGASADRHGSPADLVEKARSALAARGEGFQISASCGAADLPAEAQTAAEALRVVDQRMYAEKARRSSRVARQTHDLLLRIVREREPELGQHADGVARDAARMAQALALEPTSAT